MVSNIKKIYYRRSKWRCWRNKSDEWQFNSI